LIRLPVIPVMSEVVLTDLKLGKIIVNVYELSNKLR